MRSLMLAAVTVLGLTGAAFADVPGKDWMSIDQAKSKLMAAGYTSVTKIEADDGHYEGEGMKGGALREFHLDPHSGALTKDKPKT